MNPCRKCNYEDKKHAADVSAWTFFDVFFSSESNLGVSRIVGICKTHKKKLDKWTSVKLN